ncbi:MAG TPA: multicopper oxidase family protein [Longimicrobiales bacterium]
MALPSAVAAQGVGDAAGIGTPCSGRPRGPGVTDPDLYCIDLVPTPDLPAASGVVELGRVPTPFGVAVTADGVLKYDLRVAVEGLPAPETLGPYTTYVAWATTPLLRPMVKLGALRPDAEAATGSSAGSGSGPAGGATSAAGAARRAGPGRREAAPARRLVASGRIAFNKFLVLVTAERSAGVEERGGKIVLRGTSPSMRMQPHDLPFLYTLGPGAGPSEHAGHVPRAVRAEKAAPEAGRVPHAEPPAKAAPSAARARWTLPPMHPGVAMAPALMGVRPSVAPFLPAADAGEAVPDARPTTTVPLQDGDTLDLVAGLVRRTIAGRTFVMYGFNGQIPGPLIRVPRGATIVVRFTNRLDLPTAVHWHGVRLDNRYDGVPGVTQDPVPPGGTFEYRVHFRDAGIYWYHPHHREDITQDLGLYGNMLVGSPDADAYGPVHREEVLTLDDLLVADAGLVPYGREAATHALMGRFGNVLLVNGEPGDTMAVRRGEVVRFYLTNVSNTRVFNLSFGGAAIKLVGSDIGRYEREQWVESVVLAPAERAIVDVRFDAPGVTVLENRVQGIDHLYGNFFTEADTLVRIRVADGPAAPVLGTPFETLRRNDDVVAEIASYRAHFGRPVDHELLLTLELDELPFPIGPLIRLDSAYFHPVEWTGTMPMMNWAATARDARWILREPSTGRENMDVAWRFRVGDVVKLRLTNDRRAAHAMQHPIHIHGQRFLVLSVDGVPNPNRVWKDTILLPVGSTAELLLELSNPGRWMLHCHIAEHMEAGMRMVFTVDPAG